MGLARLAAQSRAGGGAIDVTASTIAGAGKVANPEQVIYGADDQMRMSELRLNTRTGTMSVTEIDASLHSEFCRIRDNLVGTDRVCPPPSHTPSLSPPSLSLSFSLPLFVGTKMHEGMYIAHIPQVRFGYAGWMEQGQDFNFRGMSKWDLRAKKLVATISYPDDVVGEEPVFIPHGGEGCDDGFVATVCIHQRRRTAELVLYNATTFSAEPVARVRVPVRMPHGFHGLWLSDRELKAHLRVRGAAPPDDEHERGGGSS